MINPSKEQGVVCTLAVDPVRQLCCKKKKRTKGQKFLYKEDSEPKELGMTVATQRAPLNIWGKKKREKQKNR